MKRPAKITISDAYRRIRRQLDRIEKLVGMMPKAGADKPEPPREPCPDCGHSHTYDSICGMLLSDREPDGEHFCHCQRPEGFEDPEPGEGWPRIRPLIGDRWAVYLHPKAEGVLFGTEAGAKTYIQGIAKLMNEYQPPDAVKNGPAAAVGFPRWYCMECKSCRRHCGCPTGQGYELVVGECSRCTTGQPYADRGGQGVGEAVITGTPGQIRELLDAAESLVYRIAGGESPFHEVDTLGNMRWARLQRAVAALRKPD